MSNMNCSEFLDHIDEWIEGQEVPGARDHSRGCENCRTLAEELATIRLAAVTLPETDDEPSLRVWKMLRADLEREGLIRQAAPLRPDRAGWLDGVFSFVPRPALAGAYVAALVAVGVVLSGPANLSSSHDRWLQRTQTSGAQLSAQLQDAEQDEV